MKAYLKSYYDESVAPALMQSQGYTNRHQVPQIEKVVLNTGINSSSDKTQVADAARDLGLVAGQKAVITKATKAISNFKLREGMPVGAKVTLRGQRMYDFLYRLIAVALPTIRDFRGVSAKFDGNGNYNLGVTDITIFPEISIDTNKKPIGLDVTIVTTATTDEEGRELLRLLGMPFRRTETVKVPAA
jgi:large subunit ribosomal protein L5